MKNKFLSYSLLFVLGLIFLILPAISLAAISSVTTNAASTGLTSVTLSGTIDIAGASETYDRRGFNLGTVSANGGEYNMGSSSDTGGPWIGDGNFTHATTSLANGTVYYFRAYAASSTASQLVYGSERTFLTGIDAPSDLASASAEDKIKLSWTAGAGATKTVVRYNDGTTYPTATSSGSGGDTISSTNLTFYNLPKQHTYYFSAWSSTTNATAELSTTSNSYVTLTAATTAAVVGSSISRTYPTTYSDSLVINAGAATTESREVTLALKAGNTSLMTICNRSDLLNCSLENFTVSKPWTLTEGDGVKTVYVKFLSPDGLNSETISATITLEALVAEEEAPAPAPTTPAEEAPAPSAPITPAPVAKPILEMTADELKIKIAEILSQIETLEAQLAEQKEVSFETNIKYGNRGDDVMKLQEVLIGEGLLDQGLNTGWFGSLTKTAVIKFQEKYASEILTPNGLIKGTGFVGASTRAKLDELLSK